MPTPKRRQPTSVISQLIDNPYRFGFFQAVRLLKSWFIRQEKLSFTEVLSKRLKFRNSILLSFPPSEIVQLKVTFKELDTDKGVLDAITEQSAATSTDQIPQSKNIEQIELTPAFMGLLGATGALPTFYTELLAQRELYQRDTAARAFLDIFQQRAVVMFYQAWCKHRLPIQFEADRFNQFLPLVLSLGGVGQQALRDRLKAYKGGVSDDTIAFFTGLLQQRPVSAFAIKSILSHYFGLPIHLEQFVGRWFSVPPDHQSSLGMSNMLLGSNALAGERVWQRDLRMRLTIGPMRRNRYKQFLPGGTGALALKEFIGLLTGVTLEYELRLCLHAEDVIPIELGSETSGSLGWDSYLVTQKVNQNRSDASYEMYALA